MTLKSRQVVSAAALAACVVTAGCGGGDEVATPVAAPSMTLSKTRIPLGSPVDVTYKFAVSSDAPGLEQDYRVLVHVVDADGELMWTDDHLPLTPTSQWRAGETIEYQRKVFVPIYPYVGPATIRMGLYSTSDQQRLPLQGDSAGQRSYVVANVEFLPQSENVFIIYKDGWHRPEVAEGNSGVEWQWTQKDATLTFRNPRKDSTLYLKADGRPDLVGGSQQVELVVNGAPVETVALTDREEHVFTIPLSAAQLGPADMVEVTLRVDKTFVPAALPGTTSSDTRELGVRVFNAFVEPHE